MSTVQVNKNVSHHNTHRNSGPDRVGMAADILNYLLIYTLFSTTQCGWDLGYTITEVPT
jgi:hypothetical protein